MNESTPMPALLACRLTASNKKRILQDLSDLIANHTQMCPRAILSALLSREKLGTTAIGEGMALPHAMIDGLDQSVTLLASLAKPVDFDAPDGNPVDIVCVVLGGSNGQGSYIGTIRYITDALHQHADAIRRAKNTDELQSILATTRAAAA